MKRTRSVSANNMQRRYRYRRVFGGLYTYIQNSFDIFDFSPWCASANVEIKWSHCFINSVHYYLADCYYPPKPKHTEHEFVRQMCKVTDSIMASVDQPYFIIAGDFNSLDTSFLETDYGLNLIMNSITHDKRILEK